MKLSIVSSLLVLLTFGVCVHADKMNQNGYSNTSWSCKFVNDCGMVGSLSTDARSLYGATIKTSALGDGIQVNVSLGALKLNQLSPASDQWDPGSGFVNPCVQGLPALLDQLALDRPGSSITISVSGAYAGTCPSP